MKYTNKWGLPEAIVRGARKVNEQYDNGGADVSVTQLIQAPRVNLLRKKHFSETEKDISDEWYALFGSAVHYILSLGADHNQIAEERLHIKVNGFHVSGAIDLQTVKRDGTVKLSDYKMCPVYAVQVNSGDGKTEWENQLNVLAYLVEQVKGVEVSELEVVALLRDWQRTQAQSDIAYPPAPIHRVPVALWSREERERYVKERVSEYGYASMMQDMGEPLPACSREDRWIKNEKWALYKGTNKKATKVFDNPFDAGVWKVENETEKVQFRLEHRPGAATRCLGNYCMVAQHCDQWAADPSNPRNSHGEMEDDPEHDGEV